MGHFTSDVNHSTALDVTYVRCRVSAGETARDAQHGFE